MKFGEVVKELEKIDLMVESHKYYYDFQYYYQLKYCDIVIRLFRDWLKIENCNNENQWEFSIDLDKMNNFSIEEKNNIYSIKINNESFCIEKIYDEKHIKNVEFWENWKKEEEAKKRNYL